MFILRGVGGGLFHQRNGKVTTTGRLGVCERALAPHGPGRAGTALLVVLSGTSTGHVTAARVRSPLVIQ